MSVTGFRFWQYVGLLLIFAGIAAGYWYWRSEASTNKRASNTGLVGYWSFDEGSGTQAGDGSGQGNHGTLTNMEAGDWIDGKRGKALNFDGVNEYVVTGSTGVQSNNYTWSAWVMVRSLPASGNQEGILDFGDSSTDQALAIDNNFAGRYGFVAVSYCPSCNDFVSVGSAPSLNQWYHLTIVRNTSSMTLKLYVNGVEVGSDPLGNATASYGALTSRYLGQRVNAGYFDGYLDEVRIYNRALTGTEITNLYTLGAAKLNTDHNESLTSGLVGLWSFNGPDISGTTAYDRSGSGNNGTLTNGPTAAAGISGQALSFDGSNDLVSAGSPVTLDNLTNLSVSFWANPDAIPASNDPNLVGKISVGFTSGWGAQACDTSAANCSGASDNISFVRHFATNPGRWRTPADSLPAGTWSHVVVTHDGTTNAPTIYVNGVSQALTTVQTPSGSLTSDASNDLIIGNVSDASDPFDGKIDEVRVYNRALSATEIESLYRLGQPDKVNTSVSQPQGTGRLDSGLAGYWPLDDGSGTNANDASTNNNDGTLTNGPTWTTGQIGGGVDFDGSDDYISYANTIPFNSDDFSVSAWARMDGAAGGDGENSIFTQRITSVGAGNPSVTLYYDINEYPSFFIRDNVGTGVNLSYSSAQSFGAWQHIVGVKTATATTLYLNGAAVATTTHSLSGDFDAGVDIRQIGRQQYTGGNNQFNGVIDEVRVYQRALSADEVAQLYRLTSPTGVDTSLKGYWSFNGQDMSGTTAYDRSGAGVTGTLTNGPVASKGNLGQGVSFDGTDDYVTGSISSLDTPVTLCAWYKPSETSNIYDNTAQSDVPLMLRTGSALYEALLIYLENNAASSIIARASALDNSNGSYSTASGTTNLWTYRGQWIHVCGVFTSSTSRTVYLNGVAEATDTATENVNGLTTVYAGVGTDSTAFWGYAKGTVDEARVYNRALSSSEIAALYNQGR